MKKLKALFLSLILLIPGCGAKATYFSLDDKYYNEAKIISLDSSAELKALEDNKESFAVYVYLEGCLTCASFKPIVEEYVNSHNLTIYSISISKAKSLKSVSSAIKYAPSVLLYNEGEIVSYLSTTSNNDAKYYKTIEDFTIWFESHIQTK